MERDFGGTRSQAGPLFFFPSGVEAIQLPEDVRLGCVRRRVR